MYCNKRFIVWGSFLKHILWNKKHKEQYSSSSKLQLLYLLERSVFVIRNINSQSKSVVDIEALLSGKFV